MDQIDFEQIYNIDEFVKKFQVYAKPEYAQTMETLVYDALDYVDGEDGEAFHIRLSQEESKDKQDHVFLFYLVNLQINGVEIINAHYADMY